MSGYGITEKKLRNRRFRRTEEAILKVFFEEDIYIGIGKMAEKAGVARSTVYHHHRAVREIVPDYRKYILRNFKRGVARILVKKNVRVQTLYEYMIYFMIRHKKEFMVLAKGKDCEVLIEMLKVLRGKIEMAERLPKNSDKIYIVYTGEVMELIKRWMVEDFDEAKVKKLLTNIMYLTTTMRERLMPISE